jgi:hypothetical protein
MHTPNRPTRSAAYRGGHPSPIVSDHRAKQKPRRQDVLRPRSTHGSNGVARCPVTSERPPVATLLATSTTAVRRVADPLTPLADTPAAAVMRWALLAVAGVAPTGATTGTRSTARCPEAAACSRGTPRRDRRPAGRHQRASRRAGRRAHAAWDSSRRPVPGWRARVNAPGRLSRRVTSTDPRPTLQAQDHAVPGRTSVPASEQ